MTDLEYIAETLSEEGMRKKNDNQLSIFDIELPPPETVVKQSLTTSPANSPKIPPTINFARVPDEEYSNKPVYEHIPRVNELLKKLDRMIYKVSKWELLSDLFEMGAIAISNQFDKIRANEREKKYLTLIKKYSKEDQETIVDMFTDIYKLLTSQIYIGFGDYLGELYMSSGTSSNKSGQFFTPYCVSKLCAQCAINPDIVKQHMDNDEILTLHEPTCGSGGMVLAAVDVLYNQYNFNYSRNLVVECGDIDARCVHMAYLQLSLAGVPAIIFHRDALTMETWARWETPAYIMQWLRFRNVFKGTTADTKAN